MEIKGIIHTHSTYSYDAKLSLPELKTLFQKAGICFVCMTEHVDEMIPESARAFVEECEQLSDESFLFVPGFEVPYRSEENGTHAHVLMIGLRDFFGNYAKTIDELRQWSSRASFVVLAHPVRNQFLVDDGLLHEIDALEVWNQQYEGKRVPRTRSLMLLGELRNNKESLLATGGVDFHRTEHLGGPFVTLDVASLSEASIIEKLGMGAYRVHSPHASFYGTMPSTDEVVKQHRLESAVSVAIIVLGKFVNATLSRVGLKFPKGLTQLVRKRL